MPWSLEATRFTVGVSKIVTQVSDQYSEILQDVNTYWDALEKLKNNKISLTSPLDGRRDVF